MVFSASIDISLQDKVPLGNQDSGSISEGGPWQAVWWGKTLRALQSWSLADCVNGVDLRALVSPLVRCLV